MSFALRGLSSFRVSFIRGFTVGRYQWDVVGKGVRVERLGGEEVWFLFDFCNEDERSRCKMSGDWKKLLSQNGQTAV